MPEAGLYMVVPPYLQVSERDGEPPPDETFENLMENRISGGFGGNCKWDICQRFCRVPNRPVMKLPLRIRGN